MIALNLCDQRVELRLVVEQVGIDWRRNRAGGDGVDCNSKRPELHCQIASEHADTPFARAIRCKTGEWKVFVNRADVDDSAWALRLSQMLNHRLRSKKHGLEIDVHHLVVILLGYLPKGRLLLDARIVDQDVESIESRHNLIDHRSCFRNVGEIGLNNDASAPNRLDLRQNIARWRFVATVIDRDVGPLSREAKGDRAADSPTATGHKGDFFR
jgi:hypothetical protein